MAKKDNQVFMDQKDPTLETGVYGYDVEKQGRKMSRVGDPLTSDSDSGLSVGKQMELEATNSIKYRTCSWPKVSGYWMFYLPSVSMWNISEMHVYKRT